MIAAAKIMLASNKLFFHTPLTTTIITLNQITIIAYKNLNTFLKFQLIKYRDWNYNTQYFSFQNSPKCALFSERQTLETAAAACGASLPLFQPLPTPLADSLVLERARMCARPRNWGSCACLACTLEAWRYPHHFWLTLVMQRQERVRKCWEKEHRGRQAVWWENTPHETHRVIYLNTTLGFCTSNGKHSTAALISVLLYSLLSVLYTMSNLNRRLEIIMEKSWDLYVLIVW